MKRSILAPRSLTTLGASALAALGLLLGACAEDPPKPAEKPADKPAETPADKPAVEEKKVEPVKAPAFTLKDLEGKERTLAEFEGKWVVLEWTNYDCPYVQKHYATGHMQALQKTYTAKDVVWLSICSSGEGKQGHKTPDAWKKAVEKRKAVMTSVLLDGDGKVGHLYGARTTPDMRVIDPKGFLVYTGAIDDTKDAMADPAKCKNYVAETLDAVLAGKPAPVAATPSYG